MFRLDVPFVTVISPSGEIKILSNPKNFIVGLPLGPSEDFRMVETDLAARICDWNGSVFGGYLECFDAAKSTFLFLFPKNNNGATIFVCSVTCWNCLHLDEFFLIFIKKKRISMKRKGAEGKKGKQVGES